MEKYTISIGKSRTDISWKVRSVTWPDLCRHMSNLIRTSETTAEYFAMSKDSRGKVKDIGGFVGGKVAQDGPDAGRRKAGNVPERDLVTLDADNIPEGSDVQVTLEKAVPDTALFAYTTHSHTPDAPRWRVVIPLSRTVTAEEYPAVVRRLCQRIGMDWFDQMCVQPERLMYWPSCPKDGEFLTTELSGEPLDPDKILHSYLDWTDASEWPQFPGETKAPGSGRKGTKAEDPTLKDNIVGTFCRAYDIHRAIRQFLPTTYRQDEHDPNRYTYIPGHTSNGFVVYDGGRFAYSNHGTDPVSGQMVNAFDLVRIHLFGSYDSDPDRPANRQPSWERMTNLVQSDEGCRKQMARDAARKNAEAFGDVEGTGSPAEEKRSSEAEKPTFTDWMEEHEKELRFDKNGTLVDSLVNITLILENDPRLAGMFKRNLFREQVGITGALPWPGAPAQGESWNATNHAPGLRVWLERNYRTFKKENVTDAMINVSYVHGFHPVRDYLNGLAPWDGKKRLDTVLSRYLGAYDNHLNREIVRKWFVAAVKRVFEPGCKFDYTLALAANEGIGKSSFCRTIALDWHIDSLTSIEDKDGMQTLRGGWIIEIPELSALKKSKNEFWKSFLARQIDTYRASYEANPSDHPRQCVFIITTNEMNFLLGDTGNRRMWVVDFPVDYKEPWNAQKQAALEEERDQLWAEALALYKAGERLYLDGADEAAMRARQIERNEASDDPRRGVIEQWLSRSVPSTWHTLTIDQRKIWTRDPNSQLADSLVPHEHTCPMEILTCLFDAQQGKVSAWDSKAIRQILISLGWQEDYGLGLSRFDKALGRQRWFTRPVTEDMIAQAKEDTRHLYDGLKKEFGDDEDDIF